MALREHPMSALRHFLPSQRAFEYILQLIDGQGIDLEIKKERKTIYGNFQVKKAWRTEKKITINGNLSPLQFYITLIHEIAHMLAYDKYGMGIKSHGKEWKSIYSQLLQESMKRNIFPPELSKSISQYALNPKASSCTDTELAFALHKYENPDSEWKPLGMLNLSEGQKFEDKAGDKYKMIRKLKKNYLVLHLDNQNEYIAPPTLEAKL